MSELNDMIEKVDLNVVGKESQCCLAGYGMEIRRHAAQMITAEIFPRGALAGPGSTKEKEQRNRAPAKKERLSGRHPQLRNIGNDRPPCCMVTTEDMLSSILSQPRGEWMKN
jgi:hypothetical protein